VPHEDHLAGVLANLDLQLVLVVGVVVGEVPEVLGDVEAPLEAFRGHKVLGHLDAVVHVSDLRERYMRPVWAGGEVPGGGLRRG